MNLIHRTGKFFFVDSNRGVPESMLNWLTL